MHSGHGINNVVILGDPEKGETKLLKLAIEQLKKNPSLTVEILKTLPKTIYEDKNHHNRLIFFVIDESSLYQTKTQLLEHLEPIEKIRAAWQLANQHNIVHIAIASKCLESRCFT